MTGLALLPSVATNFSDHTYHVPLPMKAGSAGKAIPGFTILIVDDAGVPVPTPGTMGNIVLALPLAPTGLTTLWRDEERFYKGYLKRFKGKYIDTGDAGMIDSDGYVHVMSRADDIINVAAHRLSTGAIEQAITTHPDVTEAAVVGIPDELKGHVPFAFIGLRDSSPLNPKAYEALLKALNGLLRKHIGPIASLAGFISAPGTIPKTRSGKTLRRCLKEILENAVLRGEFDKEVTFPATIEDPSVLARARAAAREFFGESAGKKLLGAGKAKL
jgi:propionyl-CoA synthetase